MEGESEVCVCGVEEEEEEGGRRGVLEEEGGVGVEEGNEKAILSLSQNFLCFLLLCFFSLLTTFLFAFLYFLYFFSLSRYLSLSLSLSIQVLFLLFSSLFSFSSVS